MSNGQHLDIADKPTGLKRLSEVPGVEGLCTAIRGAVDETSFILDPDDGLTITEAASEDDMKRCADILFTSRTRGSQAMRVVDRFLGQLIAHHSMKNDCTWAESIETLGLCHSDGRSLRSLSKLPRIVERLDNEVLMLPDLTTKHFDQATSYQMPESHEDREKWNERVKEILVEASENPTEKGSGWVGQKMKALQKEFGIETGKQKSKDETLRQLSELSYMLMNWTDKEFEDRGYQKSVVTDHYQHLMDDALLRNLITCPDDPIQFVPFWEKKGKTS